MSHLYRVGARDFSYMVSLANDGCEFSANNVYGMLYDVTYNGDAFQARIDSYNRKRLADAQQSMIDAATIVEYKMPEVLAHLLIENKKFYSDRQQTLTYVITSYSAPIAWVRIDNKGSFDEPHLVRYMEFADPKGLTPTTVKHLRALKRAYQAMRDADTWR